MAFINGKILSTLVVTLPSLLTVSRMMSILGSSPFDSLMFIASRIFHSFRGFSRQEICLCFQHLVEQFEPCCSIIKPILSLMFSSIVSRTVNSGASRPATSITLENLDAGKSFLVRRQYILQRAGMNLDLASSCLCIPNVCL